MSAHRKLALGVLVIAGVTGYVAYLGASASWQYYVTVDECLARATPLLGARVRVSGKVSPDTLQIASDRREAAFSLQGSRGDLAVTCSGPLPDNLAEGIDVVVEGRLEDSHFLRAHKVITRCASKYQSQASVRPMETAARTGLGSRR
jgi:cytochrome c-type biogenesis protein CcmE